MPLSIDFYFDYFSPYSYLANTRLGGLGVPIAYRPVSILDVMALVNNQPSRKCPPKVRYAVLDAARWAKRYGVPLVYNQPLWKEVLANQFDPRWLTLGAIAAQQASVFDQYHAAIFDAVWRAPRDLLSDSGRQAVLRDVGLSAESIWDRANSTEVRDRLDRDNRAAAEKGVFGAPTFFIGDEMFFGNDRLDFVAERISAAALA